MTERGAPIITLRDVRKSYGRNEVLRISELELRSNEAVLFWGPNACGKSTLLRLLAGVTVPTSGSRWLDPAFQTARRAILPQAGGLYEDLTIRQNLLVLSRLHNRHPDEAPFAMLLDEDAGRDLNKPLGTLSGGMQRIVSIAALLSLQPDFLFLDEPFGGLDTTHCDRLRKVLRDVAKKIPLLIITEHNRDRVGTDWRMIGVVGGQIEGAP